MHCRKNTNPGPSARRPFTVITVAAAAGLMAAAVATGSGAVHHSLADNGVIHVKRPLGRKRFRQGFTYAWPEIMVARPPVSGPGLQRMPQVTDGV
jgi:hypothetical protein